MGGGAANNAIGVYGSILGGQSNTASGTHSTAVGGYWNTASGTYATVGGGVNNVAGADYATIAGGGRSDPGNVSTGNRVTDRYGTVGGGGNNQAGDGNTTTSIGSFATVAGGLSNSAGNTYATVAGGFQNSSSAFGATASGGYQNVASGNYASVLGGRSNAASGIFSLAAGYRAKATTRGSFVWADSTNANFSSTEDNQFSVRATGGVRIVTNSAAVATGCSIPAGGGSWQCTSDRNSKANFAAVDTRSILDRVVALPIQLWNYKSQQADIKHIGPMAQDFVAAFGVGDNDTTISTVDADGVALAAIQGLNRKLDQENQALKVRVEALEQRDVSSASLPSFWIMLVGGLGLLNLLLMACVVMLVLRRRTTQV